MSVSIVKYDETYVRVTSSQDIERELYDRFSFMVKGAEYVPAVKARLWDGKIRLYSTKTKLLYYGLHSYVAEYCKENGYECIYEDGLDIETAFSVDEFRRFVKTLHLSVTADGVRTPIEPHDFQERAVIHAVQTGRTLLLSPTSSGKSLMIYILLRHYILRTTMKILVIVPNVRLVQQLFSDFQDYAALDSWEPEDHCHLVYDGSDKVTDKQITISTWQALAVKEQLTKDMKANMTKPQQTAWRKKAKYVLDEEYFDEFSAVFGDECLHPTSKISMSDGTTKNISDVVVGDVVFTINETTHKLEPKPVLKVHHNLNKLATKFCITMEDGSEVIATANHKFLLRSGEWKRADELAENDDVINISDVSLFCVPCVLKSFVNYDQHLKGLQ